MLNTMPYGTLCAPYTAKDCARVPYARDRVPRVLTAADADALLDLLYPLHGRWAPEDN